MAMQCFTPKIKTTDERYARDEVPKLTLKSRTYFLLQGLGLPRVSDDAMSLEKPVKIESLINQEEVKLCAKIESLGLEIRKVPPKSAQHLNKMQITEELDKL